MPRSAVVLLELVVVRRCVFVEGKGPAPFRKPETVPARSVKGVATWKADACMEAVRSLCPRSILWEAIANSKPPKKAVVAPLVARGMIMVYGG